MGTQTWRAADIKGLTPALDLRKSGEVYALGGKNFYFDSHGPKSGFGNRLLSSTAIGGTNHVQSARLKVRGGDRVFYFLTTMIVEWREDEDDYVVVYAYPTPITVDHRWSSGYLNRKIFFCHPDTGILIYDTQTGVCAKLVGPGVPEFAFFICVDNGRLIALDQDKTSWSAPSNGADFEPRLGGAGFQANAEKVSGDPIAVSSFSKGVLVWTTGGVMCGDYTGDAAVYRWRTINTEYRPVNSFCLVQLDDSTSVVLDKRGFFQSRGQSPEPLTPLFNEFLIEKVRKARWDLGQNARLEWDELSRRMYLSVSSSQIDPIYERSYVLYPPLDKWGTFDEPHYGIVPVRINTSQRAGDYFGFVGLDRRVRYWTDVGSRQAADGTLLPLDASIQIGLIRLEGLTESLDQMTTVNRVMIGNVVSGDPGVPVENYALIPDGEDEDYNVVAGAEDFGDQRLAYVNHKIRIISTNDGSSRFDSADPILTTFSKAARHYACESTGVWHMLELRADAVGEMFHCRAFELNATYAGRIA